jgi:hypothetical protein
MPRIVDCRAYAIRPYDYRFANAPRTAHRAYAIRPYEYRFAQCPADCSGRMQYAPTIRFASPPNRGLFRAYAVRPYG